MIALALFLVILCGQSFGMYQPGTPGAKWTEAEILAVKNRWVETLIFVVSKSFVNDAVYQAPNYNARSRGGTKTSPRWSCKRTEWHDIDWRGDL